MAPPRRMQGWFKFTGIVLAGVLGLLGIAEKAAGEAHYAILHGFTYPPSRPGGGVIQGCDGNFYGTTSQGGNPGQGTVFRMDPSGTVTILHSFTGPDGANPQGTLLPGSDGSLYGTTVEGGASGKGTVFRLAPDGTLITLYAFSGGSDGAYPYGGLLKGGDGSLYGTTYGGGLGTVFKLTPDGTLTTLHAFSGSDGAGPYAGLLLGSGGTLYGTTVGGGASDYGTVFRLAPDGSGFTTLYAFNYSDGAWPYAGVLQGSDGSLYGTTSGSGSGGGTVFRLAPDGTLTTLYAFSGGSDGAYPYAGLLQGGDGSFYGTTSGGGASGNGTVFKFGLGTLTTLYAFSGGSDGSNPYAGLFQGSDGTLFGTTNEGGASGNGTVFRLAPDGSGFTPLHAFSGGSDGAWPYAGVLQGSDGSLYGTTWSGGASGNGTVFKFALGTLTTLHAFSGSDGAYPYAGLLQGRDESLYGTTISGGASGNGTVFRLAPIGTLTTLSAVSGGSDGANPYAGLLRGSGGSLYGTTSGGGASGNGTVYRLAPDGTLTTLYAFSGGSDGVNPYAGLLRGRGGSLYGTTSGGGSGYGTVFRLAPDGTLTTLYAFSGGSDGAYPQAGLLRGSDGNLYGTTNGGGVSWNGTVFRLAPDGSGFTTLHTFNYSDGAYPQGSLLQGSDGNVYGTAHEGGPGTLGVVFRLQPPEPLTVSLAGLGSGTVTSAPAGLACPGTCTAEYPIGTLVTLTATPALGSAFVGWGGACVGSGPCTLRMSKARSVVATFRPAGGDLVVTAVNTATLYVTPGGKLRVTDTTQNQGSAASGPSVTGYYLALGTTHAAADIPLNGGVRVVSPLKSGQSSTGTVSAAYVPHNTPLTAYYLMACADRNSHVVEGNEANNCAVSGTQISVTQPDLTVSNVSVPTATLARGKHFPLQYEVTNLGHVPAGLFVVRAYLSLGGANTILLSSQVLSGLDAAPVSVTKTASVMVSDAAKRGVTYQVRVCADPGNAVHETNEGNNCALSAGTITVK